MPIKHPRNENYIRLIVFSHSRLRKVTHKSIFVLNLCLKVVNSALMTRDVLIRSVGSGSEPIWAFFCRAESAFLKVDTSPIILFFLTSEHNLWQNTDARGVTQANL